MEGAKRGKGNKAHTGVCKNCKMGGHSTPKNIVKDYFRVRKERPGQAALAFPTTPVSDKKSFTLNVKSATPTKSSSSSCGHRECLCDSLACRKPALHKCCIRKPKDRDPEEGSDEAATSMSRCESRQSSDKPWDSDTLICAKTYEIKLIEMQGKANHNLADEKSQVLLTGACWKVLYDICEEKLPFAKVLRQIYDELQHALYSKNEGSTDEKVPYFVIVKKLQDRIAEMDVENNILCTTLASHQSAIATMREHMKDLKDLVFEATSTGKELEGKIEATMRAIDAEKAKGP